VKKLNKMLPTRTTTDKLLHFGATMIVTESKLKAPVDFGELRDSEKVIRKRIDKKRGMYIFGFNRVYAEVMDRGFRERIIRPKKAKALYIPITRLGKRTGPQKGSRRGLSQSRNSGGAVAGRDFIFAKSVKAPKMKSYGSKRGPNRYFSGTIRKMARNPKRFLRKMGEAWVRQIRLQQGN